MIKNSFYRKGRIIFRTLIIIVVFAGISFSQGCEKQNTVESSVVINEVMPVNTSYITDQNGEYDDWIELFNNSYMALDISGYYLSDSKSQLSKWKIPDGTIISGNGYLVFWADKDTTQTGLHTNFKLSSNGESVYFSTPDFLIIDKAEYPVQSQQLSWSRNPNGTGSFKWQSPTFNTSNN